MNTSSSREVSVNELDKVIKKLEQKYNVHTVILYGSRAGDHYRDDSDYDLLCIRELGDRIREVFQDEGLNIDLIVDCEKILDQPDDYLYLWKSKVLLDQCGFSKKLNETHKSHFDKGPMELSRNRFDQRKKKIEDTLKYLKDDNVLSNYKRIDLLAKLLPLHFSIIGEWFLGDKHALDWLQKNDVETFNLFENALVRQASFEDIQKLVQRIIQVS